MLTYWGKTMSIKIEESNYQIVRNNDPLFQVMTRISDTNNVYDVKQRYIKTSGNERNDFKSQLDLFDNNKGILNDGIYVNLSNFFTKTEKVIVNGVETVKGIDIPYFKFKTNAILDYKDSSRVTDTYIDKKNYESIYDIKAIRNSDGKITYGYSDKKTLIENVYNSYPLQRADKLCLYELDSLFIYINGRKIPDNEVFVYTNKSFTDVFVPQSYIPGDIYDTNSSIDATFYIDYRQPGSEAVYLRENITGSSIEINLNEQKYAYRIERLPKKISIDQVMVFVNGYLEKCKSITLKDKIITVEFNKEYKGEDIELYILNDVVYRYKIPETSMLNTNGSKIHFYLNDDYYTDVLNGPITKNALSFYYDGKRVDDDRITQTSRFSFEYQIGEVDSQGNVIPRKEYMEEYVYSNSVPDPDKVYYKLENGEYIRLGKIDKFDDTSGKTKYFTLIATEQFDEKKIDFIVEDLNYKVYDLGFKTYGDDYYLLNMLGVRRCVDKMKGSASYSIFDDPNYYTSFREVLSKNGDLFDVSKAIKKYDKMSYDTRSPEIRTKLLIEERPTLIRRLFEQFKVPSKRMLVLGNEKDITISSVTKLTSSDENVYYKVYVNHILLNTIDYTISREGDYDIITINKKVFDPIEQDKETGQLLSGRNEVEVFQYDITYRSKTIFKDNINNDFEKLIATDGSYVYRKTYKRSELPFINEDDIYLESNFCALEQVRKSWYDSTQEEFYYIYPTKDNIGYRLTKYFRVTSITNDEITFEVTLYNDDPMQTAGNFYILIKQYNVAETIMYTNEDNSYMTENDLLIPVYSDYVEYGYDEYGKRVIKSIDPYIPYINDSEPIITNNGKEQIFGKDYTYSNPETNKQLATSYIILKAQPNDGDTFVIQFNSNKTNILIVGYDDLDIDNRYGLVYLSELPYPVSPEYMNIFINGEKLSTYDMDILSDKLIRFHHITRPIRSILITTNLIYKNEELEDYISLYKPSDFEKLLEEIFWNCDPSKAVDANKPNIDFVYKVNPYYEEFVGELENKYDNPYYKELVDDIIKNGYKYDNHSSFTLNYPLTVTGEDPDYNLKKEAYDNAEKFFNEYRSNHGFVPAVDSVLQAENRYDEKTSSNFITDTLEIMYVNWLCCSGKTRSYGFKDENIDPMVLKYFSVFENVILNNRIDIVVDSNRFYDGMRPDVNNPIIEVDYENDTEKVLYPAADFNYRRWIFYEMLIRAMEDEEYDGDIGYDSETGVDGRIIHICKDKLSNILYPEDQPLSPDEGGIRWTGTNVDICNYTYIDDENEALQKAINAEKEIRNKLESQTNK